MTYIPSRDLPMKHCARVYSSLRHIFLDIYTTDMFQIVPDVLDFLGLARYLECPELLDDMW